MSVDVAGVGITTDDPVDDLLVHIDEHDVLAGVRKDSGERHPHVSGTHDGHVCTHARTRLLTASKSGSACGRPMTTSTPSYQQADRVRERHSSSATLAAGQGR